jgi:hypothetical protein
MRNLEKFLNENKIGYVLQLDSNLDDSGIRFEIEGVRYSILKEEKGYALNIVKDGERAITTHWKTQGEVIKLLQNRLGL